MLQLKWIAEGGSQAGLLAPVTARHKTRERVIWASAGFVLAAMSAAIVFRVLAGLSASPLPAPQLVKRVTIKLPDTEPLALAKFGPMGIGRTSVALSPDGSLLAYAAEYNGKSQLSLRALDRFDAKPIPAPPVPTIHSFRPMAGRWDSFRRTSSRKFRFKAATR